MWSKLHDEAEEERVNTEWDMLGNYGASLMSPFFELPSLRYHLSTSDIPEIKRIT